MAEENRVASVTTTASFWCPVHGDQGTFVGVEVYLDSFADNPLPASLLDKQRRRYCMACWIESMDASMQQLIEIPANEKGK